MGVLYVNDNFIGIEDVYFLGDGLVFGDGDILDRSALEGVILGLGLYGDGLAPLRPGDLLPGKDNKNKKGQYSDPAPEPWPMAVYIYS